MSGSDRFFVDTNLLLYAIDSKEPRKKVIAAQWMDLLWALGAGCLSWQVLHEFYANATRKMRTPDAEARQIVLALEAWTPEAPSASSLKRAWHWCDKTNIGFWDAMMVGAAEQAGCPWLLTEDLQAGQKFGAVTVVNPFKQAPEDFLT